MTMDFENDYLVINLRGTTFTTKKDLLQNMPETRLSNLNTSSKEYNKHKKEYFFDRNPSLFHCILDLYDNGTLHLPLNVCASRAKAELEFWEINPARLESCCWKTLHEVEEDVDIYDKLSNLDKKEGLHKKTSSKCVNYTRKRLWLCFSDPKSSVPAKIWFTFILLNAVCSIIVYGLQTQRQTRIPRSQNVLLDFNLTNQPSKIRSFFETKGHPVLNILDQVTNSILLLDVILRGISSSSIKSFVCNVFNICESLAVVSVFIMQYADRNPQILAITPVNGIIALAGWLYGARVLRILRLAEHLTGMKILKLCLLASKKELAILALSFLTFSLIFASLIYTAEVEAADTFPNFFICIWWSVITMTTVGYGDLYPKSTPGYIVGALTAITGILLLAMPIAILSSNFSRYYGCFKIRGRYMKMKRKFLTYSSTQNT